MKIRLLISSALVAASIFVGAAPAQAGCMPEDGPCCNEGTIPGLWKKLTGEDMFHCPW